MLKMAIFSTKGNFHYTTFTKAHVKQKVAIIERHMTSFWKEERWGYNIYQTKQNLFWEAGLPYTLSS